MYNHGWIEIRTRKAGSLTRLPTHFIRHGAKGTLKMYLYISVSSKIVAPRLFPVCIDDDDYQLVSQYKWSVYLFGRNLFYAQANIIRPVIYMHRLIMQAEYGQYIDHINRNPLDNRKDNLRITTQRNNISNAGMFRNNTTGYRGVIFWKNKYIAQTKYRHGLKQLVGQSKEFDNPYAAALVRDEIMRQLHGDVVFQNLPDIMPDSSHIQEATRVVNMLRKRMN